MGLNGANGNGANGRIYTRGDLEQLFDERARRMLDVPAQEALRMLDAGELEDTIAGSELRTLRSLLETA